MRNIEQFNLAVSEILGLCYEQFPNRVSFSQVEIANKVSEYYDEEELEEIYFDLVKLSKSTVKWLEEAGYLWIEHELNTEYHDVTLTPKAFELLNMMPDSLKPRESIGELLVGGAKETGKTAALAAIKLMLSEGVRLAI
ncbi:TPA: hypothetical protein ACPJ0K_004707 [Vibrio alginolyticus]|nr:hypothetical protein [Vibrio alginolyticus]